MKRILCATFLSKFFLVLFTILASYSALYAQDVVVSGRVMHGQDPSFNLLIVNKTTGTGFFGDSDGRFKLTVDKNDTLLIGALGYQTIKVSMSDSVLKDVYKLNLYLSSIQIDLKAVTVFPERELDSIQRDIRKLGYDQRDYMLSGIDAMYSPLTYLYQQVSKKERMKRRAYEIINEDQKRALLKELFVKYVNYDIIDLRKDEFEDFIDFMNVPEQMLKSMSQYEFIIYTKNKFEAFRQIPPRLRPELDTHD